MVRTGCIAGIFFILFLVQFIALSGQRISVNGIQFEADGARVWLNGTNTPWDKWNDFGGGFEYDWWNDEFQELKDLHINCTRVWITCDGSNTGVTIGEDGFISGVNSLFWSHVDQLMEIAQDKQIYLMIALISFDHTKPGNTNASRWINMYNSATNRQSFADNYAVPFVNRYKNNPYFFAVDVGNELEWVWENHGVESDNVIDLISRVADAVKANSEVLVCQGLGAGIKYNTSAMGGSGNYLADVSVDFYNIHYYDWQNQWFGNPFDYSPTDYNINSKPCIIGESSAKGSAGYTPLQCYQKAFEKGWQGLMVWTSNGVDGNGDKYDSKPGTDWIYANYPGLIDDIIEIETHDENTGFKLFQNSPNPFNSSTTIRFTLPHTDYAQIQIYDSVGNLVKTLVDDYFTAGSHTVVYDISSDNGSTLSAGSYFYHFKSGDYTETGRMLLMQ